MRMKPSNPREYADARPTRPAPGCAAAGCGADANTAFRCGAAPRGHAAHPGNGSAAFRAVEGFARVGGRASAARSVRPALVFTGAAERAFHRSTRARAGAGFFVAAG